VVLVATEDWSRLTDKALGFALTISPDVYAVHLKAVEGPEREHKKEQALREQWAAEVEEPARAAGMQPPKLVMLESRYRRFEEPLLGFVEQLQKEDRDRVVAVLLPSVIKPHWWAHLLHTNRARRMRSALLKTAGPRLVVMTIPWSLERHAPAAALEVELKDDVVRAQEKAISIGARLRNAQRS
jgi:hypothetical protein